MLQEDPRCFITFSLETSELLRSLS